jgi:hypothetical protein
MTIVRRSQTTYRKTLSGLGTGFLLLFSLNLAATDLYRWTDARVTHFTDKPPHGVHAEKVNSKRSYSLSNPAAADEAEGAAPESERCRAERERLGILQSNGRIQMEGRDGAIRELTAEEIQQEIAVSERAIARLCSPADAD